MFKHAKADLGEILSSCEFMDNGSMDCVTGNLRQGVKSICYRIALFVYHQETGI